MRDTLERAQKLARNGAGCIPGHEVVALVEAAGVSVDRLMLELIPLARQTSTTPQSGYKVGAIGMGVSGALYLGSNFEFERIFLNHTVHAEQAVVINAATHGETGLARLAISAPPCGYCRQFLYELATAQQLEVVLESHRPTPLVEYLPGAFGPVDLGLTGGLLRTLPNPLRWSGQGPGGAIGDALLQAANRSYAPYTKSFAAVALYNKAGLHFVAPYLENAAFNPSVSALSAALVVMSLAGGGGLLDVEHVVVAEAEGSPIDHTANVSAMLQICNSGAAVSSHILTPNR